ncbi:lipase 3-like [Nasonia vitripennis]|uniref:Partial AB-hydrolase lipase domain-containing protein n=1 Tax=Nasonia vitripennis TaxID=7425 RepID=A0A7M7T7V0_NASVI|nr:lipase 3-like [Nasonia vitripennis]XP_031780919.1 lipase 3-like [Nasonia vitripennis]XP_031780920.1 lipase 3-like [Nasonia vitripennis]XP_031780921.1 lipase 3-like [Nasonia vitripennis]XP_031780922.1 lipase 3-like [Nasonia vitripennis]XP_031780923.1 lipase 3-like [Nasonia vitripennis]XP_031780924.1 lipase 3-like [Nasonia vitripennis]
MEIKVIVVAFFVLCLELSFCLRFEDLLPIKYDIVKVRNESQMKSLGNRYGILDFIGLVERHGYTAEEYKLTTWDGYILVLHRITGSPLNPKAPGKPVVFLQHGILCSSDTFVLIGPGKDLAFLLADAGYDVWLGNARGNTYSRSHVFLSPKQKEFWEFSYHETGLIDLCTSIDYALAMPGQRRIILVGYSMGTTEIFALLSTMPEYNAKISLVISLAPVVFWTHKLPILMKLIIDNAKAVQNFSEQFHFYDVLPQSSIMGN